MKTIFKYEIPGGGGEVLLPVDAVILTVAGQGDSLFLWAEVDPDVVHHARRFEVLGTGFQIREEMGRERQFIGTAFLGPFVLHVYEIK